MNHRFTIILFLFFCISFQISGQQIVKPSLKFGKPSNEELEITTYPADTTASAIVLYDIGPTSYRYDANEFSLTTQHRVKIKILKPNRNSKKYADLQAIWTTAVKKNNELIVLRKI